MAYYLVSHEGALYANDELYYTAIAGGERAFMRMLAGKQVVGKNILDQILYPVTVAQKKECAAYTPTTQDLDTAYKHFNVLSKDTIRQIRENKSPPFQGAAVVTLTSNDIPELFRYRRVQFFRVRDYKEAKKYHMVPKMAALQICGYLYVALNAVDVRVDAPIVVTLDN
jgi:hypothetical protein